MSADIVRRRTPDEHEFEEKRAELAMLEAQLVERELELTTFQAELSGFEVLYLRVVGRYYAELDDIEAQIAEVLARLQPKDDAAREYAAHARAQAHESAEATGAADVSEETLSFQPSGSLKRLFREIARRIHPDLGIDEEDRAHRHQFMAEANDAYKKEDEARLRTILHEWEGSLETAEEERIDIELARVINKIAQITERLHVIENDITRLRASDHYRLKIQVDEAQAEGRDLLDEMAERIKEQITAACDQLDETLQQDART